VTPALQPANGKFADDDYLLDEPVGALMGADSEREAGTRG
jgi:hypothetical protein